MGNELDIKYQTGGGWKIWFIVICCLFIFLILLSIGGYYYYQTEEQLRKHQVQTDQALMKSTPYIIYETNIPQNAQKCMPEKTYGVNANGDFYIRGGCSGIFLYRDVDDKDYIGTCTSSNLKFKRCPIGEMIPDVSPTEVKKVRDNVNPIYSLKSQDPLKTNLSGLIEKHDKNIVVMEQNGLCTPENYGFYGNDKIYTKGGCNGIFRLGPLIGECGSTGPSPDSVPTTTYCPIGYKKEIDGKQMGLVLTELRAVDTSSRCQSASNAFGYRNSNTGFRDPNACEGDMVFTSQLQDNTLYANYDVECDTNKADCDLSSIKK